MPKAADRPAVVDQPPTRRDELDRLRALVVVGLVFFPTAVIFGADEFPIKAPHGEPGDNGVPRLWAAWACRCCS